MKFDIVEDSEIYALELRNNLQLNFSTAQIDVYSNAEDYLKLNKDYDMLFLDIELPGIDGISLAKQLNHKDISIIFITSLKELIFDAFGSKVVGFLLKTDKMQDNLTKIIELVNKQNHHNYMAVKSEFGDISVSVDNIVKITKENRKIYIYTNNAIIQIYGVTLHNLQQIASNQLVFVNRSCLVNITKIIQFNTDSVLLFGNITESISRSYASVCKQLYLRSISF